MQSRNELSFDILLKGKDMSEMSVIRTPGDNDSSCTVKCQNGMAGSLHDMSVQVGRRESRYRYIKSV